MIGEYKEVRAQSGNFFLQPTVFFIAFAFGVILLLLFGDGSLEQLDAIKESLRLQKVHNAELSEHVDSLTEEAHRLQTDDRFLEKTARDELGLARPGEQIFLFKEYDPAKHGNYKTP